MRLPRIAPLLRVVFLTIALSTGAGLASFALAQTGHPAKGGWMGFWGPTEKDQRRLLLEMDWKNNAIDVLINPGPKAVKAKKATLDYETWTLVLEADMPDAAGKPKPWVATGKLENLGSWNNRRYSGTYTFGTETGKFQVALH
jgi:hypothetical protein